jgi:DNA-binding HxlR family transcriptional regulator
MREFESGGSARREIFPEVPPHVEYSLTPAGHALRAVIQHMCEWGQLHVQGAAADFEAILGAVS